MQLTKLEVTNFGPHKHVVLNMDDPIVGFFGTSGSGKSIMIDAIRFLINGDVSKPPLEDYIRGRGVNFEDIEDLPKSALVKGDIIVDGQDLRIERAITATSTRRKIFWDGKEFTSKADTDKIMSDLLGADSKAIAACVFPAQGELQSLLFGTQREREELFVKLLLLSDYAGIANQFDSQAKLLTYGLADRTGQRDLLLQQQLEQEEQAANLGKELTNYPDQAALLVELRNALRIRGALQQATRRVDEINGQMADLRQTIATASDGRTMQELLDGKEAAAAVIENCKEQLRAMKVYVDLRQRKDQLNGAVVEKQAAVANYNRQVEEATAQTMSEESLALLEQKVDALTRLPGIDSRILQTKSLLEQQTAERQQALDELSARDYAAEIETLNQRNAVLQQSLANIGLVIKVRTAIPHDHETSAVCPVCESLYDPQKMALSVPDLLKQQENLQRELTSNQANIPALQHEKDSRTQRVSRLEIELQHASAQLAAAELDKETLTERLDPTSELADPMTLSRYRELVKQTKAAQETLRHFAQFDPIGATQRELTKLTQEIADLDAQMQAMPATRPEAELQAELQQQTQLHVSLSNKLQHVQSCQNSLDSHSLALQNLQADVIKQMDELRAIDLKLPAGSSVDDPDLSATVVAMEEKQNMRLSIAGRLEQARRTLNQTGHALAEIDRKDQQDAAIRTLAGRLQDARSLFVRQGLPMAYIRYCYGRLVELAARNLEYLDADYTISVDPNNDVSMLFTMAGEGSGAVFAMGRLSGGQRVRLCVAFLLAIQQLILPDLGFLVLDEPSMHLGDEYVEAMADLFVAMRTSLKSAHAQIIIADHNDLLKRAMGIVHDISVLKPQEAAA